MSKPPVGVIDGDNADFRDEEMKRFTQNLNKGLEETAHTRKRKRDILLSQLTEVDSVIEKGLS